MMNTPNLIIADADAIVALASKSDANHEKAKHVLAYLSTMQSSLLFPLTAICEATTALQGKLSNPQAAQFVVERVQSGDFPIQTIDHGILVGAIRLFHPHGSKKNTLFDAIIATIAKQFHADAIFSFDSWYKKIGLHLVSDFIKEDKAA
jgi:predicted nucleic acid-binding protein